MDGPVASRILVASTRPGWVEREKEKAAGLDPTAGLACPPECQLPGERRLEVRSRQVNLVRKPPPPGEGQQQEKQPRALRAGIALLVAEVRFMPLVLPVQGEEETCWSL